MKKAEEKRKLNLFLKHSYLRSMDNVEEVKVDFHKVMGRDINLEAGQRTGKTLNVFTTIEWVT